MDGAIVISGIISLIVLILFFVLVARVGAIRTLLEQRKSTSGYAAHYEKGELAEYLGKKEQARESFKAALFYAEKIKSPSDFDKRNLDRINKKLEEYI